MVQRQIHVTEKAYKSLKKVKGEYMSFTDAILYLIKQNKEYIVLQTKYDAVCEELEELKNKLKRTQNKT